MNNFKVITKRFDFVNLLTCNNVLGYVIIIIQFNYHKIKALLITITSVSVIYYYFGIWMIDEKVYFLFDSRFSYGYGK